jgi:hypothetical protein
MLLRTAAVVACVVGLSLIEEYSIGAQAQSSPTGQCVINDDCVPKECCHARTCVLDGQQDVCADEPGCTEICEVGTMDCGYGTCACGDAGACVVKAGPARAQSAAPARSTLLLASLLLALYALAFVIAN